jgi:hypothetical protein
MMTPEERERLSSALSSELLPNLDEVLRMWQGWYSSASREDRLQPLLDGLATLRKRVLDDPAGVRQVDAVMQRAREWMDEEEGGPEKKSPADRLSIPSKAVALPSGRSVFDDVDA